MMQWNTLNIGNIKNNKILHINKKILENKNPGSFFKRKELCILIWTLFVLDYDGTYSCEHEEYYGVRPSVYQIPLDKQQKVEMFARRASKEFHESEDVCESIGDIFEGFLEENNIKFHCVGDLKIRFGDRQKDYLADYIPREIV